MQDLTQYYSTLLTIHKTNRNKIKSFILSQIKDVESTHPLIIQQGEYYSLKYSLDFKGVQNTLVKSIKDFLYYRKNEMSIIINITETNKKLNMYKSNIKVQGNGIIDIQNILNSRIIDLINKYIRSNLVISSYIKDIIVLYRKKSLSELERNEIEIIIRKIHKMLSK